MDCEICGKILSTPQTLQNHMFIHKNGNERPFKCQESDCSASFSAFGDMNRHYREIHSKFRHLQKFPCHISGCEHILNSKQRLNQHIEKIHSAADLPALKCSLCPFQTTRTTYLTKHIKIIHLKDRKYSCSHGNCKYKSTTSCNLDKHRRTHLKVEDRRFPCPHSEMGCSKRFNSKAALRIHERAHTQEKNYPCSFCDYRGRNSGNIKMHMTTHTKERGLQCKLCDYATPNYGTLNQHIQRIHLKEKGFPCTEPNCESTFVTKMELKIHEVTHTREQKFKCEQCQKTFTVAPNLARHLRTVHRAKGEKPRRKCPFSSSGCSYRCDANSSLKSHIQSRHSTERPFSCELCAYTCKVKSSLRIHKNQVHKRKQQREDKMQGCSVTSCGFSTKDGAELALHFENAHQLPKVHLKRIKDQSIIL